MEKRLFIAVKYIPDNDFLHAFGVIKQHINSWASIKWVESHQLHLTLCFLGNTQLSLINSIDTIVEHVGSHNKRFEAEIIQLSTFGQSRNPRVLWMGVRPVDKFRQLHIQLVTSLMESFAKINEPMTIPVLEVDNKFVPHLTLGRFKSTLKPEKINEYLVQHSQTIFGCWPIDRLILYESILTPSGPNYKIVKSVALSE
ncbi:MAG: RNA 2',3'-cyclic phosphodiesterase [Bacteroidales bacterium]|nr:RNA 2',3'-cyclic phosphodiesterase [Bacteroidales bacterium]